MTGHPRQFVSEARAGPAIAAGMPPTSVTGGGIGLETPQAAAQPAADAEAGTSWRIMSPLSNSLNAS